MKLSDITAPYPPDLAFVRMDRIGS